MYLSLQLNEGNKVLIVVLFYQVSKNIIYSFESFSGIDTSWVRYNELDL